MFSLPIVIKAKQNQNTGDLIRLFKKAAAATDIVQIAKDRRYFSRPSQIKAKKLEEIRKFQKRARAAKRMKNQPRRGPKRPVRKPKLF